MNIYCIYWIHLPEHTNITKEGYIGVSSRFNRRIWEHINIGHDNPHLSRAIEKYSDIQYTILCYGSEEYCYMMEEKLRPCEQIGWNINLGGIKPPSHKGKKRTTEHKRKMSLSQIENWKTRDRNYLLERNKNNNPALVKQYTFIKDNEIFNIINLRKFCRDHNLSRTQIYKEGISKGYKLLEVIQ